MTGMEMYKGFINRCNQYHKKRSDLKHSVDAILRHDHDVTQHNNTYVTPVTDVMRTIDVTEPTTSRPLSHSIDSILQRAINIPSSISSSCSSFSFSLHYATTPSMTTPVMRLQRRILPTSTGDSSPSSSSSPDTTTSHPAATGRIDCRRWEERRGQQRSMRKRRRLQLSPVSTRIPSGTHLVKNWYRRQEERSSASWVERNTTARLPLSWGTMVESCTDSFQHETSEENIEPQSPYHLNIGGHDQLQPHMSDTNGQLLTRPTVCWPQLEGGYCDSRVRRLSAMQQKRERDDAIGAFSDVTNLRASLVIERRRLGVVNAASSSAAVTEKSWIGLAADESAEVGAGGMEKEERRRYCVLCDRSYTYDSSYRRHMMTHANDVMTYKCDVCAASYTRRDSLRRHERRHHSFKSGRYCVMTPY